MLEFLKDYNGVIKINGKVIDKKDLSLYENSDEDLQIDLSQNFIPEKNLKLVEVVNWMTVYDRSNVSFHLRWNHGIAMPENKMIGIILEEKNSMYKMQLTTLNRDKTWTGYVAKIGIIKMEDYKEC